VASMCILVLVRAIRGVGRVGAQSIPAERKSSAIAFLRVQRFQCGRQLSISQCQPRKKSSKWRQITTLPDHRGTVTDLTTPTQSAIHVCGNPSSSILPQIVSSSHPGKKKRTKRSRKPAKERRRQPTKPGSPGRKGKKMMIGPALNKRRRDFGRNLAIGLIRRDLEYRGNGGGIWGLRSGSRR